MNSAVKFFFKHAGYSHPAGAKGHAKLSARWECARELAKAEAFGIERGWTWEVVPDDSFDWSDTPDGADVGCCPWCNTPMVANAGRRGSHVQCPHEHYVHGVVLKDEQDETLGSLWGIVDALDFTATTNYHRIVAAELASEALHEVECRNVADKEAERIIG